MWAKIVLNRVTAISDEAKDGYVETADAGIGYVLKTTDSGTELVAPSDDLEDIRGYYIEALRRQRIETETAPIEYNGNTFPFDYEAQDRMFLAFAVGEDAEIETTDENFVTLTNEDLKAIFNLAYTRQKEAYNTYKERKTQTDSASTEDQMKVIQNA